VHEVHDERVVAPGVGDWPLYCVLEKKEKTEKRKKKSTNDVLQK
jgi:hypothetical protein